MQTSENINELAAALSKAQGEIEGAVRGNTNPAFRSKYADLSSVWQAIREPFAKHGLCVVQGLETTESGVSCTTKLIHSSGQWIESTLIIPVDKHNAHGHGSAATYARRFSLSAMAGIAPVDDDGNAASMPTEAPKPAQVPPKLLADAQASAEAGTASYKAFYSMLTAQQRGQLAPKHEEFKKIAAAVKEAA